MKTSHLFFFAVISVSISCSRKEGPCEPIYPTWDGKRPVDTYIYPVYPPMEEWGHLPTNEDKHMACQVPIATLQNMSTQTILQSIWEHPFLLSDVFSFSTLYQWRLDQLFFPLLSAVDGTPLTRVENNACMELAKRKDGGAALLDRLLVGPFSEDDFPYDLYFPQRTISLYFQSSFLDLVLSRTVFLVQLNECERKTIVEISLNNWDKPDIFCRKATLAILIGKTMEVANFTPFCEEITTNEELQFFLSGRYPSRMNSSGFSGYDYSMHSSEDQFPIICNFGQSYINQK